MTVGELRTNFKKEAGTICLTHDLEFVSDYTIWLEQKILSQQNGEAHEILEEAIINILKKYAYDFEEGGVTFRFINVKNEENPKALSVENAFNDRKLTNPTIIKIPIPIPPATKVSVYCKNPIIPVIFSGYAKTAIMLSSLARMKLMQKLL